MLFTLCIVTYDRSETVRIPPPTAFVYMEFVVLLTLLLLLVVYNFVTLIRLFY